MLPRRIERILKENDKYARMLEEYDQTGHLSIEKVRQSFTLRRMTVRKLMDLSRETGKSMSDLIDELVASREA
jgi:hypothetical protein